MNLLYVSLAVLLNMILGCLGVFLLILWMICFLYIAEEFGYTLDPTLDEGLLFAFLPLTLFATALYLLFGAIGNVILMKRTSLSKSGYSWMASSIGVLSAVLFFGYNYFS